MRICPIERKGGGNISRRQRMLRAIKAGNAKHQQERRTICTQKVFLLPECVIILQKIKNFPLITYSCASSTNEVRGRHQKRKRPLVFKFPGEPGGTSSIESGLAQTETSKADAANHRSMFPCRKGCEKKKNWIISSFLEKLIVVKDMESKKIPWIKNKKGIQRAICFAPLLFLWRHLIHNFFCSLVIFSPLLRSFPCLFGSCRAINLCCIYISEMSKIANALHTQKHSFLSFLFASSSSSISPLDVHNSSVPQQRFTPFRN